MLNVIVTSIGLERVHRRTSKDLKNNHTSTVQFSDATQLEVAKDKKKKYQHKGRESQWDESTSSRGKSARNHEKRKDRRKLNKGERYAEYIPPDAVVIDMDDKLLDDNYSDEHCTEFSSHREDMYIPHRQNVSSTRGKNGFKQDKSRRQTKFPEERKLSVRARVKKREYRARIDGKSGEREGRRNVRKDGEAMRESRRKKGRPGVKGRRSDRERLRSSSKSRKRRKEVDDIK